MSQLNAIVESALFNRLSLGLIIISSIILGLLSYPEIVATVGAWLLPFETLILWLFVLELLMRIGSFWPKPWKFFANGWNVFDFLIVIASVLPVHSEAASVFRLVRVLRALRLLKAVPGLQVVVHGMIRSVGSLGYVGLILFIHFYIYGLAGVKLFGTLDPIHFGSLSVSFLALFQVVTLEGWADIMRGLINNGSSQLVVAVYFVSFILIGTMVIMNLVIGVIINGMMESQKDVLTETLRDESPKDGIMREINQLEATVNSLQEEIRKLRSLLSQRLH
jgi:voltage-gated sodium channel